MKRICSLILTVLLLLCLWVHSDAQTTPPSAPQIWLPSPALLGKLNSVVTIDNCTFRPPVGFLYQKLGSPLPGETAWIFENLDHFPGVATDLDVLTVQPQGTMRWSADLAMSGALQSIQHDLTNTKITPVEQGYIGNLPALRCYIKGDLKLKPQLQARLGRTSLEKHLFVYTIGTAKSGCTFIGEDIAPYNTETMPLLEASVLTMHLVPSPGT